MSWTPAVFTAIFAAIPLGVIFYLPVRPVQTTVLAYDAELSYEDKEDIVPSALCVPSSCCADCFTHTGMQASIIVARIASCGIRTLFVPDTEHEHVFRTCKHEDLLDASQSPLMLMHRACMCCSMMFRPSVSHTRGCS